MLPDQHTVGFTCGPRAHCRRLRPGCCGPARRAPSSELPFATACTLVEQHGNHRWLRPDPRASRVTLAACVKDMDQAGTLPPPTTKSRLR
mmetsp:Transcript_11182/g.18698  ORF Transcript_11182/g.18698 Transcript_11182/m.18698 type:complete len:90 (+) Transcript_11182:828-1097(+)